MALPAAIVPALAISLAGLLGQSDHPRGQTAPESTAADPLPPWLTPFDWDPSKYGRGSDFFRGNLGGKRCLPMPRVEHQLFRLLRRWGFPVEAFDRGTPDRLYPAQDGWFSYAEVVQTALDYYWDPQTSELKKSKLSPFFISLAHLYFQQVSPATRRLPDYPLAPREISLRDQYFLSQTMKLDPSHGMAYFLYGKARGNIAILVEAAMLLPDFYPVGLALSLQYFLEGSIEVPTQILEKVERDHPKIVLATYLKAKFLHDSNRDEEALESVWEILKKAPQHREALVLKDDLLGRGPANLTAGQLYRRGLWYEYKGQPDQAYAYFHWALAANPENLKSRAALFRVKKSPRGTAFP